MIDENIVSEEEADRLFEIYKSDFANHLLLAAHAAQRCMELAPDGTEISESYMNPICWLLQHAEEIMPSGEAWPELPDNVIPLSKYMRQT